MSAVLLGCAAVSWAGEAEKKLEVSAEQLTALKLRKMNSPMRSEDHPVPHGVDLIGDRVKRGITILDIGAGQGDFAFEFSKRTGGKAEIFATDTDPLMIAAMKDRIAKDGIQGVTPVQVMTGAVDPFYKTKSFDLVMASRMYHALPEPGSYFKDLRPSIKPGGRLYIIATRPDCDLRENHFPDFPALVRRLKKEGKGSPYFRRLPEPTRVALQGLADPAAIPPELGAAVLRGLNGTLEDPTLFPEIKKEFYRKFASPKLLGQERTANGKVYVAHRRFWEDKFILSERPLAMWLVAQIENAGAFDGAGDGGGKISEADRENLRLLNKTLITSEFDRYSRKEGFSRHAVYFALKRGIIHQLEKAGYTFVGEHDYAPVFYFLEFGVPERK